MNNNSSKAIKRKPRIFVSEDLEINSWNDISGYFENLHARTIKSGEDLRNWLLDLSELEAVISDDFAWRYIHMTCNTTNDIIKEKYEFFIKEIDPKVKAETDKLNRKLIESIHHDNFDATNHQVYFKTIRRQIDLFRKENTSLFSELQLLENKFNTISGGMTVQINGNELTLQQAAVYLKDPDRSKRERIYNEINDCRIKAADKLNHLFSEMVRIRDKIAKNAGFDNYRDYKHAEFCRFDYTVMDCYEFHNAIFNEIKILADDVMSFKRSRLKVNKLKPWDIEADESGKPPLQPFRDTEELTDKTIQLFYGIEKNFGDQITAMKNLKQLDLSSRIGKAPGGYNYPLIESGIPFIFMNSVGTHKDLITMFHEGGHAIHSFFSRNLEFSAHKHVAFEVAELASMSMELFTMDSWGIFYQKEEDLKRAQYQLLSRILGIFPWVAAVDKFQHWIYTNPNHLVEERNAEWEKIFKDFSSDVVDWSGQEKSFQIAWQKQPHIFVMPFYYIEYAIAQLGAIALWKQFKKDPVLTIKNYCKALSLGSTRFNREIYETAGIKFDFSKGYVSQLINFVNDELKKRC